jgi:hypothetical protein
MGVKAHLPKLLPRKRLIKRFVMIAIIENIKNRLFAYLENMLDFGEIDLNEDDDILEE